MDLDSEDDDDSIYGEGNDAKEVQCLVDAEGNTTDSRTRQQDENHLR
jgi:hypothetical protein